MEIYFFTTTSRNVTVVRYGVSLVTIIHLDFVLIHWIQWKWFRKNSNEFVDRLKMLEKESLRKACLELRIRVSSLQLASTLFTSVRPFIPLATSSVPRFNVGSQAHMKPLYTSDEEGSLTDSSASRKQPPRKWGFKVGRAVRVMVVKVMLILTSLPSQEARRRRRMEWLTQFSFLNLVARKVTLMMYPAPSGKEQRNILENLQQGVVAPFTALLRIWKALFLRLS